MVKILHAVGTDPKEPEGETAAVGRSAYLQREYINPN
jgi:hypothetical protein